MCGKLLLCVKALVILYSLLGFYKRTFPLPPNAALKVGILWSNTNPLKYSEFELYSNGFSELSLRAKFEEGDMKKHTHTCTYAIGIVWRGTRPISEVPLLTEIEL